MKILICNFEYPPLGGGGGVSTSLLAQEMARRHEVTVLTSRGNGTPYDSMENGVRVVRVPVFFRKQQASANFLSMLAFIPMGIRAGKRLMQADPYDIINTHFVLPTGPVGDALARFGGIPNVLSLHGGDLYEPSKFLSPHRHLLLRAWVRYLIRRADMVVGQSRDTLENMHRFYAPEIEGIRIPLGIQRPTQDPALRASYGFAEDETLLITVGRLVARKAIAQLIQLMGRWRGRRIHLLIVGTGPQERMLHEMVSEQRLNSQVHFMGYVEEAEKFRILQMCDLFVSTSQHEGFCLAFLEAMACGLPIVCYDHGGQRDFLCNQKTGYLIPLNDLTLFADRCEWLIEQGTLRQQISQENQRRAEEFCIDRCAAEYEGVFRAALQISLEAKGAWELRSSRVA